MPGDLASPLFFRMSSCQPGPLFPAQAWGKSKDNSSLSDIFLDMDFMATLVKVGWRPTKVVFEAGNLWVFGFLWFYGFLYKL